MSDTTANRRRPNSSEQLRRFDAACRDSGAVQELLEIYRPLMLKLAHRQLNRSLRAKVAPSDLVQTAMWKAHQAFGDQTFASVGGFRAWLVKILDNEAVDAGRRYAQSQKRDVSREQSLSSPETQVWIRRLSASLSKSALGDSFVSQRINDVLVALDLLPSHYRLALRLRYFEKLSFEAMGEKLERTTDSARMLHNRALSKLRELLRDSDACTDDSEPTT